MAEITELYIGQELDWLHGLHSHRVATVLAIKDKKVKLQGVTTEYWIDKKTILKRINKPYPGMNSIFAPNERP